MCCAVDTIFQPRMTRITRILLAALYSFRHGLRGITRLLAAQPRKKIRVIRVIRG